MNIEHTSEIEFKKYHRRGAYHWEQISYHPVKRNAFVLGRYRNFISLLNSHVINGLQGRRILDVGCGDGVLAYLLHQQGVEVFGIDTSELALRYAKEKTRGQHIHFCHGSAYEMPWKDKSFDVVVSSDVIEHVQNVHRFLVEIRRLVKKGGHVVISTPIRFTEEPLDSMHVTEWYPEEYQRLILKYFPTSSFYQTHPVFWGEMMLCSTALRILVNVLSMFKNPFENFQSRFRYKAVQFSVSEKEEL